MFKILLLLLYIVGALQLFAEEDKLKIITEEWPPYNYKENGKLKGFSVEVIQVILKKLNLKNKIIIMPGARAQKLLDEEDNIMNFSLFRTKERENKYKWIGPISHEAIYFYKKKGSLLDIKSVKDAKKVNAITTLHKGLIYSTLKNIGFTNIDASINTNLSLKKVLKNRVDLGVSLPLLGLRYQLKKENLPLDAVVLTSVKLLDFPLYIACSKNISTEIITKWQHVLDEIKKSEEYEKIYNKYLNNKH